MMVKHFDAILASRAMASSWGSIDHASLAEPSFVLGARFLLCKSFKKEFLMFLSLSFEVRPTGNDPRVSALRQVQEKHSEAHSKDEEDRDRRTDFPHWWKNEYSIRDQNCHEASIDVNIGTRVGGRSEDAAK